MQKSRESLILQPKGALLMRLLLVVLAASLPLLPAAQAWVVEANYTGPYDETVQSVLGHGCLIVGVAGWPPEPRVNPDCVGEAPSEPPSEPPAAPPSNPDNSTGGP